MSALKNPAESPAINAEFEAELRDMGFVVEEVHGGRTGDMIATHPKAKLTVEYNRHEVDMRLIRTGDADQTLQVVEFKAHNQWADNAILVEMLLASAGVAI